MTKMREDFQRAAAKTDASKRVGGTQTQTLAVKPPADLAVEHARAAAKASGVKLHTQATEPGPGKDKGPSPGGP